MYRIIVATLPKSVGRTVTTSRFNPFQSANLYAEGNNMLLPPDNDKGVRILYDKVHKVNDGSGWWSNTEVHKEPTKLVKIWIQA